MQEASSWVVQIYEGEITMSYVLKCSACGITIPVEPIVARLMMDNKSNQSWCSSCGASDTVTLVEEKQEEQIQLCKKCGNEIVLWVDSDGNYWHPFFMGYCPECDESIPYSHSDKVPVDWPW